MKNPLVIKLNFIYLLFALPIVLFSCKDDELIVDQSGDFSYFPLETGNWSEFEVDSIVHYDSDDFLDMDTAIGSFHFYVREVIDTPFYDGENEKAFVIQRYRRTSDTLPWTFMNVWTTKVTPNSAQKVEDNIRFIRLHFPINSNSDWNGNAYNFFHEETYSYDELYQPRQYGNLNFDSTVTVLQNDFVSHVNRIYKKEIYGAGAGLIFKELDSVNTKITTNGTIILNGLEYKFNIIGYNH